MAEPSAVYQGTTPSIQNGGLNALQLALASYMAQGNPPPFAVNNAFMETMKTFTDPGELSPFDIDTATGLPRVPDLLYNVSEGIAYIARGEDIYLLRRAEDCGPDENRLEEVFLGRRPDVADGTWAFYGQVKGGSVAGGSFEGDMGPVGGVVVSPGSFAFGGYDFGLGYGYESFSFDGYGPNDGPAGPGGGDGDTGGQVSLP